MKPLAAATRYLIAVAIVAAAVGLRWLLDPVMGDTLPLVTLFGAVAAVAWLGGYRPAVLVAVVGYLACAYLFIEPRGSLGLDQARNVVGLIAYTLTCAILIGFCHAMRVAERRADHRREALRTTLASIGDAVIVTDPASRITNLNLVAESLTGWKLADALGQPLAAVFRVVAEDTRQPVDSPVTRALSAGVVVGLANHTVLIAKDGSERAIDDSAAPIRSDDGEIVGCVLTFRDITERRRAELELARSQRDLTDFFDNASVGLHWVGPDRTLLRVNQTELDLLGYTREEYVGRHIAEFHVDRAVIDDILARLTRGETLHEHPARMRCKDGSIRDVLINSNVLFEDGVFIHTRCFTRDITESKQAEAAIRSSEQRLRMALTASRMVAWQYDPGADRVAVSDNFAEVFGLAPGAAVERADQGFGLLHPDDLDRHRATVTNARERCERYLSQFRIVRPIDGAVVWMEEHGHAFRGTDGDEQLSGVVMDITARRRGATLLAAQKHILEMIATGAPLADVLLALANSIEEQDPRLRCSIVLLDADGAHLRPGGGAGVLAEFLQLLDGAPIEPPYVAPCAMAARTRQEVVVPDVATDDRWSARWRELAAKHGVRSCRAVPVASSSGRVLATFTACWFEPGQAVTSDPQLVQVGAQLTGLAMERRHDEQQLSDDLGAMTRLQALSTRLVQPGELESLLSEILAAATGITRADKGNIQLYDAATERLRIVVHQGHGPRFVEHFATHGWSACCDAAARKNARVVIEDVARLEELRGTPELEVILDDGVRAVQSTPLIGRDGKLLGMLSNHFRVPHRPSDRDLRYLDLMARMAADFIERSRAESALRESETLFRTLGEAMPDFLWMTDAQGRPIYQNPAWRKYVGMTHEDLGARSWEAIRHPDDLPRLREQWTDALAAGEAFQTEARTRRHDGEYRWFAGRTVPLRDDAGRVVKWIGTMTDIDDLKQADAALREADRRKNEFLAMLAHELRNPLAPIRSALQIVRLSGGDGATVAAATAMMERQVAQMVRLVDDLLDVSRITRGRIELRKELGDVASLVRDAVDLARTVIEGRERHLTLASNSAPIYVDADRARLSQVVGNLLSNACKFTDRGGHIEVATERDGEHARIRVRDNGVGMAAHEIPRIFDMFMQVDTSLERSAGGLGIGLTLVKSLVEAHGGTVEAQSDGLGRGSEFTVRLPLAAAPSESAPPPEVAAPLPAKRHGFLIVDDNRDGAQLLARLLTMGGHETHTAHDGLAALEAAERFRPDVIVLDIGLPKLNGYDVCRRLRGEPWAAGAFIVALTGWGHEADKQKSSEAGFDAHLVKPANPAEILQLVAQRTAG